MPVGAAKIDRVRVLLGAVQCEKGDLSGNLARHVALMEEAHRSGCELAIFPEFSLTGSVDPLAHPEHALVLEHPAVEGLVDATAAVGVGAVFGLAEHRAATLPASASGSPWRPKLARLSTKTSPGSLH